SVELMGIASKLEGLPDVTRAGLVMATPANLGVLAEAGLADGTTAGARPSDLIVAVAAANESAAAAALARAAELLNENADGADEGSSDGGRAEPATTLRDGLSRLPNANLAVISTPGTYATAETLRALKHGLNVFLFSDNVS